MSVRKPARNSKSFSGIDTKKEFFLKFRRCLGYSACLVFSQASGKKHKEDGMSMMDKKSMMGMTEGEKMMDMPGMEM
jgi:hypothetical protein